jgi:hypothetical protein
VLYLDKDPKKVIKALIPLISWFTVSYEKST